MRAVDAVSWDGKTALLRVDFNTPMTNGKIADDSRIRASVPTIQYIVQNGGGVVCLSHLGRPKHFAPEYSLRPAAERLSELCNMPVMFHPEFPANKPETGEVWMLENTRFNQGEKENSPELAVQYAALGDVFVLDAFAVSHRTECSLCALAEAAKDVCAGLLLRQEIDALSRLTENPARPFVAIVGGGKISSKLSTLERLCALADRIVVGGGIANTFFAGLDMPVGASLVEDELRESACKLIKQYGDKIVLPSDVVVAGEISATAKTRSLAVNDLSAIAEDEMIVDVGDNTRREYSDIIRQAGAVVWSGPLGAFEYRPFAGGTREIAETAADSSAYSVVGGGDTLSAVTQFNVAEKFSYRSTGGSAFLAFLGGDSLPALLSLQAASARQR